MSTGSLSSNRRSKKGSTAAVPAHHSKETTYNLKKTKETAREMDDVNHTMAFDMRDVTRSIQAQLLISRAQGASFSAWAKTQEQQYAKTAAAHKRRCDKENANMLERLDFSFEAAVKLVILMYLTRTNVLSNINAMEEMQVFEAQDCKVQAMPPWFGGFEWTSVIYVYESRTLYLVETHTQVQEHHIKDMRARILATQICMRLCGAEVVLAAVKKQSGLNPVMTCLCWSNTDAVTVYGVIAGNECSPEMIEKAKNEGLMCVVKGVHCWDICIPEQGLLNHLESPIGPVPSGSKTLPEGQDPILSWIQTLPAGQNPAGSKIQTLSSNPDLSDGDFEVQPLDWGVDKDCRISEDDLIQAAIVVENKSWADKYHSHTVDW